MSGTAKLSPNMQKLANALAERGFVDRTIAEYVGVRSYSATIVALMNRGIAREAGSRSGHMHFPATTPEQVWTAAHEENDAREAERVAHDDDPERWLTVGDGHTRATRQGGVMTVSRLAFGWSWLVSVDGHASMSAGGAFEEARRAADRFERNQAHADAIDENEARDTAAAAAHGITVDMIVHEKADPRWYSRVLVVQGDRLKIDTPGDGIGWVNAADVVHPADECSVDMDALRDEALAYVVREQHIAQSGVAHVRSHCPALAVGGCMKCTAPATVRAAQGDDSAYVPTEIVDPTKCCAAEVAKGVTTHERGCPRFTPEAVAYRRARQAESAELMSQPLIPAEARTGVSDRTAALDSVAELRRRFPLKPNAWEIENQWLDIIEQALRHA